MDMQPKVIFHEISQSKVRKSITAKLFPEGHRNFSDVKLTEYYGISVEFISEDPDSKVIVENLIHGNDLVISPGKIEVLMPEGDSADMIVPDEYLIRVESSQGNYESIYIVEPKNFSMQSIIHIREYLEKILRGLTLQINKRRTGAYLDSINETPSLVFIFDKVLNQYSVLTYYLYSIINNPITDIKKVYKEQIGSKNPDFKSQKWLFEKGISKNTNPHLATFVYEKRTYLSEDNIENRWLFKILVYIRRVLYTLSVEMQQFIKNKETEYEEILVQNNKFQLDLDNIEKKPFLLNRSDFKTGVQKLRDDIYKNKILMKNLLEDKGNLSERYVSLQRILYSIERSLETNWLNGLDGNVNKVSIRLLKDPRYAFWYRLYLELKNVENENKIVDKLVYPRKRNYILIEYYSVSLCIKILEELGFNWVSGWIADTMNPLDMNIPSGTVMKFENETHWIELAYDEEVERSHWIDQDDSYSRFVGEQHRRPDIRISLHNKNKKEVEGALIIEIKYRNFDYLWQKSFDTDVMIQCKAYKNIQYYSSISKNPHHMINQVIVLYPKQNKSKPVELKYGNSIVFIQIEPVDPEDNEEPYGYNELKSYINKFVLSKS